MIPLTRREFLENSMLVAAAVAAAALPKSLAAAETRAASASDKITVGIIGCGIRGKQHARELAKLADCEIACVCDPDPTRADEVAAQLVEAKRARPKTVQDLRVLLEDKSIDAVFVATPNHWHVLAAIWAMQAGKDVYVEKPVSHNIVEGRRMVEAARKLGRICQGGTQYRSSGPNAAAVDYMRKGELGEVKLARSIVYGGRGSIGAPGEYPVPGHVDYNLFCGPAPMGPLRRPKLHYDWHWFWATGNGELGNNNIHSLDVVRWGLGVTGLGRSVISFGGRLGYKDAAETPNTQVVIFDFGDKTIISETRGLKTEPFSATMKGGNIFYGTKGIIAGGSLFDLEGTLVRPFEGKGENHFVNFLNAVRSRKVSDLRADILEGHQSTALCHIGNISYRLGRRASTAEIKQQLGKLRSATHALETFERTEKHLATNRVNAAENQLTLGAPLQVEPKEERFVSNRAANELLAREYRSPFVLPSLKQI
ncbi:MAG: Gfo/Idh/MocA family oxidoreductase [Opitutaceae bacterium]|nr:Gfo/Idh/MocA family oxidoreductase [Opitutaceae bacterium]